MASDKTVSVRIAYLHYFQLIEEGGGAEFACCFCDYIDSERAFDKPNLQDLRNRVQNFPDWVDNEINNNNRHSLRSNTKGYGDKTRWTDSQNSDTTAPSSRELYHLQFSRQAASPETFGYTRVPVTGTGYPH
jgi:hypothetical protein